MHNVETTSIQRLDVESTLLQRCVPTEYTFKGGNSVKGVCSISDLMILYIGVYWVKALYKMTEFPFGID